MSTILYEIRPILAWILPIWVIVTQISKIHANIGLVWFLLYLAVLEDVETLKKRTSSTTITTKEVNRSAEVNQEISLEQRLRNLEANQMKLQKNNTELKEANSLIMEKLSASFKFNQQKMDFQVGRLFTFTDFVLL